MHSRANMPPLMQITNRSLFALGLMEEELLLGFAPASQSLVAQKRMISPRYCQKRN